MDDTPSYTITVEDTLVRIVLNDNLTSKNITGLRNALLKLLEGDTSEMIFDLSQTEFVDSAGISLFMGMYLALSKKSGVVRLLNTNPDIVDLLSSMCLEQHLNVNMP